MQIDLPTSSYATFRPAELADVPRLLQLVQEYEKAVTGESSSSEAEVAEPLTTEKGRRDTRIVLAERDGAVVGRLDATRDGDRWYGDVTVDVALPDDVRDELVRTGLEWVERTATTNADDAAQIRVKHWCWESDEGFARRLTDAGYRAVRAFIEMHLDLAGRTPLVTAPDVTVTQADLSDLSGPDARTVYELISESFRDHYDYHERTFEDWIERRATGANVDLEGWFIARVDGRPAGGLIHDTSYLDAHNANYVANLGTLRWARGRGVAKALLEHSFARAEAQGRTAVKLHVDAESPTGATALYDGVGMRRHKVGQEWQRTLTT